MTQTSPISPAHSNRISRTDPGGTATVIAAARHAFSDGRTAEALMWLREAHANDVNNVRLCEALANTLAALGDDQRAALYLRHALKLDSDHVGARLALSRVMCRAGDVHGARILLSEALRNVRARLLDAMEALGLWHPDLSRQEAQLKRALYALDKTQPSLQAV